MASWHRGPKGLLISQVDDAGASMLTWRVLPSNGRPFFLVFPFPRSVYKCARERDGGWVSWMDESHFHTEHTFWLRDLDIP